MLFIILVYQRKRIKYAMQLNYGMYIYLQFCISFFIIQHFMRLCQK